jgi:hypothetical protein
MPPGYSSAPNQSFVSATFDNPPLLNRKLWLKRIILIVIVIIVIIVGLKIFLPDNSPNGIASRFVNDIVADKAAQAYSLTTPGFKAETSASDWTAIVKNLSSAYTGKPKSVSPVGSYKTTDAEQAVFEISGNGNEFKLTVKMEYYTGHWRVYNFIASLAS